MKKVSPLLLIMLLITAVSGTRSSRAIEDETTSIFLPIIQHNVDNLGRPTLPRPPI